MLRCGSGAPRQEEAPPAARDQVWAHKRIAVHGERGHAIWSMWSWETLCDGRLQHGRHDYWEQDGPAQAALVGSVLHWIEHPDYRHPLALEQATEQYAVLLAAYRSALQRRPVTLPEAAQAPVIEPLRTALRTAEAGG